MGRADAKIPQWFVGLLLAALLYTVGDAMAGIKKLQEDAERAKIADATHDANYAHIVKGLEDLKNGIEEIKRLAR